MILTLSFFLFLSATILFRMIPVVWYTRGVARLFDDASHLPTRRVCRSSALVRVKAHLMALRSLYISAGTYLVLRRRRRLPILNFYILMRSWSIARGLMVLGGHSPWNIRHINTLQIEFEKLYYAPSRVS